MSLFWHEVNLVITKSGNFGDARAPLVKKFSLTFLYLVT